MEFDNCLNDFINKMIKIEAERRQKKLDEWLFSCLKDMGFKGAIKDLEKAKNFIKKNEITITFPYDKRFGWTHTQYNHQPNLIRLESRKLNYLALISEEQLYE